MTTVVTQHVRNEQDDQLIYTIFYCPAAKFCNVPTVSIVLHNKEIRTNSLDQSFNHKR
jgi:hypothetical protein